MTHSAVRAVPVHSAGFPIMPIAAAVLLPLGLLYVLSYVSPAIQWHSLSGQGFGDGKFLFDSIPYYETAERLAPSQLFAASSLPDGIRGLGLTNIALFAQGKLAMVLFPWEPSVGVFLLNVLLFSFGMRNVLAIARELDLGLSAATKAALIFNPAVLLGTVSLTKEVWGFALVTGFSLAAIRHRWISLAVLAVVSLTVREYYLVVAVVLGLLTHPRLRPWVLLVLVAFLMGFVESVLGFGDLTGYLTVRSEQLGQQTAALMTLMGQIQSIPFGHIVAFPIVLVVNIASPMFNPSSYSTPVDSFFLHATTISSYISVALILVGVMRHRRHNDLLGTEVLGRHLLGFAILLTLYPVSQHRYLLVAYPLLVLWSLAGRRRPAPVIDDLGNGGSASKTIASDFDRTRLGRGGSSSERALSPLLPAPPRLVGALERQQAVFKARPGQRL